MRVSLVEVRDLHVNFGDVEAVRGVSFDIESGETIALVGESGSGKSVTALSILQLLPYPLASHPKGSVLVNGEEMIGANKARLLDVRGQMVSMIFQEPMTSLNPLHNIAKQVGESLVVHKRLNKRDARERTLELLQRVGLQEAEGRLGAYPHELSGGQRQRVMIAMALANEPKLLIADEPTTALDVTIQAQILRLLKELQRELGMAMLLITHDLGIVRNMADRVCVMTEGEIVETGPTERVFTEPTHRYTQHLLAAEPKGDPARDNAMAPVVASAEDLTVKYALGKGWLGGGSRYFTAVKNVAVTVRAGQTVGVVGESGSGKTTLGLAMLRLLAAEGQLRFDGQDIGATKKRDLVALRKNMQIVFQDPYGSLSPRMTAEQIIDEGLRVHHPEVTKEERRVQVRDVMAEVGLDPDHLERYPHEFSGGQRQRISIARAMVLKPRFVVLDEPTSALDMSVQAQIVDLLRDLQKAHNLGYLFVSHDLKVVRALANWLIVMRDGEIVEQGPADEVFDRPKNPYSRALFAAALDMATDEEALAQ
ncbi:MAG: ABC transporter ATP-binding protein [Gammaproteobacteria bacterium]|nr:ABC transporter ATP-binding protein [Gammaproteobacteria bacterium]MDE0453636.1 ABC transporter ATP-binding protein [Gammaproteobacteria bacterium]